MLNTMFQPPDASVYGAQAGFTLADLQRQSAMNNQINQRGALQDIYQNEAMNPLKLEHQGLVNAGLVGSNKSTELANKKSVFELEEAERLREPTYQKKLADLLAGVDKAKLEQTHAKIQQGLTSLDPKVREESKALFLMTGDMLKMYEQQAEQRKTQYGAIDRQQGYINQRDSQKAKDKEKAAAGWETQLAALKGKPVETYNLLSQIVAVLPVDDPTRMTYMQRLEAVRPVAEATIGKSNVGKPVQDANGKWTVTPPVSLGASPATATRVERQTMPKTPQEAKAAGWKLMVDANGNSAYVGPNNQYIEVK